MNTIPMPSEQITAVPVARTVYIRGDYVAELEALARTEANPGRRPPGIGLFIEEALAAFFLARGITVGDNTDRENLLDRP